jgi:hypothetical protein
MSIKEDHNSNTNPRREDDRQGDLSKVIADLERRCMMCVLISTRKRTNRLQYSVCKCEVESTGKWSNIGVLFNQPHFNLVPKV